MNPPLVFTQKVGTRQLLPGEMALEGGGSLDGIKVVTYNVSQTLGIIPNVRCDDLACFSKRSLEGGFRGEERSKRLQGVIKTISNFEKW